MGNTRHRTLLSAAVFCGVVLLGVVLLGAWALRRASGSLAGVAGELPEQPAAALASRESAPHGVVINEVQLSNVFTALDDRGRSPGWVELYNPGPGRAELRGCFLSSDASESRRWRFPAASLSAGEYLVVWLSGSDAFAEGALEQRRYKPTLVSPRDPWRYRVGDSFPEGLPPHWWAADFDDSSFETGVPAFGFGDGDDTTLLPRGTLVVLTRRAFEVNEAQALAHAVLRVDYDDGFIAYLNGKRFASAHAPAGELTAATRANANHEATGYQSFRVPAGTLRDGRNVLAIAGLNFSRRSTDMTLRAELGTSHADLHASFRLEEDGGELLLTTADGERIDRLRVPPHAPDHSYGRIDTSGTRGFFLTPTAGAMNHATSHTQSVADEVLWEPSSGLYSEAINVVFRSALGGDREVRYTTDGSSPTARSRVFRSPLPVKRNTIFRAATFVGAERASPAISASYLFDSSSGLPILSLAMEPAEYATVHNTEQGRGRESERLASLALIDPRGELAVSCAVGLRLHGGDGRRGGFDRKKSYRLYFRGAYRQPRLEYPLFGERGGPVVDKLVLRAGLDDSFFGSSRFSSRATYLRDELARSLHRDMGALAARGTWWMLYVNMRPRGLYNVVDRIDDEFLSAHLGWTAPWDVVKTHDEVAAGDDEDWRRVVAMARRGLEGDLAYRDFAEAVDVDNFTDYVILNLWAQNHDWPANNWYAARSRAPGGKWFFLCWDAEFSFGLEPAGYNRDSLRRALYSRGSLKQIFAGLWQNDTYRGAFLERTRLHLASTLAPEAVVGHIDRLAREARSGMATEARLYGASLERWRGNVESMKEFARHRGKVFERHVETAVRRGRGSR